MLSGIIAKINYVGIKKINVQINSKFYWINVIEKNNFKVSDKFKKIFCKQITQIVNNEIKNELYGFETIKEIDWFQTLINCQGIGPKTAMKIMNHDINKIKLLIKNKNLDELKKIEGINSNIASYLIMNNWKNWELNEIGNNENKIDNQKITLKEVDRTEIISTLKLLGYDEKIIIELIDKIKFEENYEVSDIVSNLIKLMANNEYEHQGI
ncbi:Holliday junction branch migration protein RuvA [Mycoplasmoides alvi]|uniref:Holliday junction branch migration protein RuvA n=1 Tax=Mycoplasmoides alvi TaxID=78580 RepID=UPI000695A513|nr:Holliday junction branch migration protein RuvA [Mycoplasmoides alvi]